MHEVKEKRWHPLFQEWVIISETTSQRPWSGEVVSVKLEEAPIYDTQCYLCPGNVRAKGDKNPDYQLPFSIFNDFPSIAFGSFEVDNEHVPPFSMAVPAGGICKVLIYHRNHQFTLAHFSNSEFLEVINLWQNEYETLSQNSALANILIFENKGKVIGVSNLHPHGQLYATDFVPPKIATIATSFTATFENEGKYLLQEILKFEINEQSRIVLENEHWVVMVPYFAQYSYETWIVPKRFFQHIGHLLPSEKQSLAQIYLAILNKYDRLFGFSLPNITTLYNAPLQDGKKFKATHFQFFIRFTPPLRDAEKLKYLAGFETGGGNIINPIAPEKAAGILREC